MTCYGQLISTALLRGEALSPPPPPRLPGRWCLVGCALQSCLRSPSSWECCRPLGFLPPARSCPPRWPRLLCSLRCWVSPPLPASVLALLSVCLPAPAPRLLTPALQTGCPVLTPPLVQSQLCSHGPVPAGGRPVLPGAQVNSLASLHSRVDSCTKFSPLASKPLQHLSMLLPLAPLPPWSERRQVPTG